MTANALLETSYGNGHCVIQRDLYHTEMYKEKTVYECLKTYSKKQMDKLANKNFYKSKFQERLPLFEWLPKYKTSYIVPDMTSGFTIGIMSLPHSMACALLANLPPVHGLYMAFFPALMYLLFGTSRHLSIGAITIISMLTGEVIGEMADAYTLAQQQNSTSLFDDLPIFDADLLLTKYKVTIACSLAALIGVIQFLMGFCGLGMLTNYFSDSFISGYTCGAAIQAFISPLKLILGLKNLKRYNGYFKTPKIIINILMELPNTHLPTLCVSSVCIFVLYTFKEYLNPRIKKRCKIEFPIELLLVISLATLSYLLNFNARYGLDIVNGIENGLPEPHVPDISFWPKLFKNALIISVIAFSINVSLATLFSRRNDYEIDSTQELYAYGISNAFGSFFGCFPSAASLSRSTVLEASGSKSPLAILFSSSMVLIVMMLLGKYFEPLPKTCLACIIVVALKGLIMQIKDFVRLSKINKYEGITWFGTFITVVMLDLDIGLVVGLGLSIFLIVYKDQHLSMHTLVKHTILPLFVEPSHSDQKSNQSYNYKIMKIQSSLYFANINSFKTVIKKLVDSGAKSDTSNSEDTKTEIFYVLLDFSAVNYTDTNAVTTLIDLIEDYGRIDVQILICGSQTDFIRILHKMDVFHKIENNLYTSLHEAFADLGKKLNNESDGSSTENSCVPDNPQ